VIAGNLGLNTGYCATPAEPVRLYFGDFDESGTNHVLEAYSEEGRLLPRRNLTVLAEAMPLLRRQFRSVAEFGRASLDEMFLLDGAQTLEATQLAHGVFLNDGHGRFAFQKLSRLAQVAPVNAIAAHDFGDDGVLDLLLLQNDHSPPPEIPRFDGGRGLLMRGRGDGGFDPVPLEESGLDLPGSSRALTVADLDGDGSPEVVIVRDSGPVVVMARRGRTAWAE
jgi:hypothetical protein